MHAAELPLENDALRTAIKISFESGVKRVDGSLFTARHHQVSVLLLCGQRCNQAAGT
jgi:hypothetical protein